MHSLSFRPEGLDRIVLALGCGDGSPTGEALPLLIYIPSNS